MGYTPKRFSGTTAKQRFGHNRLPQAAQNRTKEGREAKKGIGGLPPAPAMPDEEMGGRKARVLHLEPTPAKPQSKADSLPLVSSLPTQALMFEAVRLLGEDVEYQALEEETKQAREEIKKRLVEIVRENGLPGLRHGRIAMYYTSGKTRRTFDAALAVEHGLPAEAVQLCYTVSKPWDEVRVVDLDKPKKGL
jgi:hypothetical protein